MNQIYRLVWSEISRTWVAVAETTKGRGKRESGAVGNTAGARARLGHGGSVPGGLSQRLRVLAASLALIGSPTYALDTSARPAGGRVVAGSAAILRRIRAPRSR